MTKTTRLLLPFSYEGEIDTIEAAVLLAASHHAAFVPLSVILTPQTRGKGVPLERIQPPKGFLEAVQRKAFRHHIPLERFEVFTGARVQLMFVKVDQLPRFRPKRPLFDTSPRRPRGDCWPAVGESHSTHREPSGVFFASGHVVLPCLSA